MLDTRPSEPGRWASSRLWRPAWVSGSSRYSVASACFCLSCDLWIFLFSFHFLCEMRSQRPASFRRFASWWSSRGQRLYTIKDGGSWKVAIDSSHHVLWIGWICLNSCFQPCHYLYNMQWKRQEEGQMNCRTNVSKFLVCAQVKTFEVRGVSFLCRHMLTSIYLTSAEDSSALRKGKTLECLFQSHSSTGVPAALSLLIAVTVVVQLYSVTALLNVFNKCIYKWTGKRIFFFSQLAHPPPASPERNVNMNSSDLIF